MYLSELRLKDFRSYEAVDLKLGPGTTVFIGPNGYGKTNLVEAVNFLATLGSHRVSTDAPLIRAGCSSATVAARVRAGLDDDRTLSVALDINLSGANRAMLNNAQVRPKQILGAIRTVCFAPEDLAIVRGDPAERRRFIDELIIARWPRLAGVRSEYERATRQKTVLLKALSGRSLRTAGSGAAETLDAWDEAMVALGAEIMAARLRTLADLSPLVTAHYAAIAPKSATAQMIYQSAVLESQPTQNKPQARVDNGRIEPPGRHQATGRSLIPQPAVSESEDCWGGPTEAGPRPEKGCAEPEPCAEDGYTEQNQNSLDPGVLRSALAERMAARRTDEITRGVCLVGPHRDDILCRLGDLPVRGYASHGESWSYALALRLASVDLLRLDGVEPVLILDDVFAELDEQRRASLVAAAEAAEQTLVTAAVQADLPENLKAEIYIVEPGQVRTQT